MGKEGGGHFWGDESSSKRGAGKQLKLFLMMISVLRWVNFILWKSLSSRQCEFFLLEIRISLESWTSGNFRIVLVENQQD